MWHISIYRMRGLKGLGIPRVAYQHIQDVGLKGLGNSRSGISAYTGRGALRVGEFTEWHISIYRTRGLKGG